MREEGETVASVYERARADATIGLWARRRVRRAGRDRSPSHLASRVRPSRPCPPIPCTSSPRRAADVPPYPCRERLLATATRFHGAQTGSRKRNSPSISVILDTGASSASARIPRVVARRRPRPRALQTLATTINTRACTITPSTSHLLPAPPRSTPRLPRSPTVASTCVRRAESHQRHAAASAFAAAFAGKPFPTNASLAALAHASYAATSAPHRSVSAAFSS